MAANLSFLESPTHIVTDDTSGDENLAKKLQEEELRRSGMRNLNQFSSLLKSISSPSLPNPTRARSSSRPARTAEEKQTSPFRMQQRTPSRNRSATKPSEDSVIIIDSSPEAPSPNGNTRRQVDKRILEDEKVARQLQQQLDSESAPSVFGNLESLNRATSARTNADRAATSQSSRNMIPPRTNRRNQTSTDTNTRRVREDFIPPTHMASLGTRQNSQHRVPESFEHDLFNDLARASNIRPSSSRSDRIIELDRMLLERDLRRTASNATARLSTALSFLNDPQFVSDFLAEEDDHERPRSSHTTNSSRTAPLTHFPDQAGHRSAFFRQHFSNPNLRSTATGGSRNNLNMDLFDVPRGARTNYFRNPISNMEARRYHMNDRDFTANDYENLLRLDELYGTVRNVSKSDIESLPTFEFRGASEATSDKTCSICFDDYEPKAMVTALACSHKFHKSCIKKWLQQNRRCPLCQKDAITGS